MTMPFKTCRHYAWLISAYVLASLFPGISAYAQDIKLETVPVMSREVLRERVLDAVVEAVNEATVSAQTSGRIAEVNYDVDDFVPKDSVLVRFRETEQRARLAQAQAEVRATQARYDEARKSFKRSQNLYANKNISKADLDASRANMDASKAQIEVAQAAVEQTQEQFDYTVVRAPYDGIVTKRHVEAGESVSPGQPLMTGFSLEKLRVRADVPQQLIYAIRELKSARIIPPDPAEGSIPGEKITIFPYASERSNTFTVRTELPAATANLFPGMLVKVAFVTGKRTSLVIPKSAVVYRSEVVGVYVVNESGKVQLRQVRTGPETDDGMIEVLAGLVDGEQVALDPIQAGVAIKQDLTGS